MQSAVNERMPGISVHIVLQKVFSGAQKHTGILLGNLHSSYNCSYYHDHGEAIPTFDAAS